MFNFYYLPNIKPHIIDMTQVIEAIRSTTPVHLYP